jgi:hypothetical protein
MKCDGARVWFAGGFCAGRAALSETAEAIGNPSTDLGLVILPWTFPDWFLLCPVFRVRIAAVSERPPPYLRAAAAVVGRAEVGLGQKKSNGLRAPKELKTARLAPVLNHQMQFVDKTIDFL